MRSAFKLSGIRSAGDRPMWASFKRYFFTMQFVAGVPLAIKVGLDPDLGWLGAVAGFFAAAPIAALGAFVAAKRVRGQLKSPPMTLGRGLAIAFVTFFMLIGILTFMKIVSEMYVAP